MWLVVLGGPVLSGKDFQLSMCLFYLSVCLSNYISIRCVFIGSVAEKEHRY